MLSLGAASFVSANDIPRRPDGRPDLSGNYDTATLTPIQRRPEVGDRRTFTAAEAEADGARHRGLGRGGREAGRPQSKGSVRGRQRRRLQRHLLRSRHGADAVNGELRTSIIVDPANGRFPPLTEGSQRRAKLFPFEKENTARPGGWDQGSVPTTTPSRSRSPTVASSRSRPPSRCCRSTTTT